MGRLFTRATRGGTPLPTADQPKKRFNTKNGLLPAARSGLYATLSLLSQAEAGIQTQLRTKDKAALARPPLPPYKTQQVALDDEQRVSHTKKKLERQKGSNLHATWARRQNNPYRIPSPAHLCMCAFKDTLVPIIYPRALSPLLSQSLTLLLPTPPLLGPPSALDINPAKRETNGEPVQLSSETSILDRIPPHLARGIFEAFTTKIEGSLFNSLPLSLLINLYRCIVSDAA